MTLAIGSDPAGYQLKLHLGQELKTEPYEVVDVGCHSTEPADYPLFAQRAGAMVASGECDRAVLICGTGQGMTMAANRIRGVRASLCHSEFAAVMSREHNDANVLCIGAWMISPETACRILRIWLFAKFSGAAIHRSRIEMMDRPDEGGV